MLLTPPQLEQALGVAEKDTKDASAGVMKDLRRFQSEKENDLRRYMVRKPTPPQPSHPGVHPNCSGQSTRGVH